MSTTAEEIGTLLRQKSLSLGTVESATGGLIAHLITNVPGSSDYFRGSVVAYANEIKIKIVGVSAESIRLHGAVSPEVAEQMAAGGRRLLKTDICLSDTGIAGPGGAGPGKPAGLFYLGLASGGRVSHQRHIFRGIREENKNSAAQAALIWLLDYLEAKP
jgi:nicotinamide-nucleotide amidase